MGSQLSIPLKRVASRVENISEEGVKDLLHDDDFVDLAEQCWSQIPKAWTQTHSGSGKRVYEPLSKIKSPRTLELNNTLREEIWKWYDKPADFFVWTQPTSSLPEHGTLLDSFFKFVLQLEDKALLNTVRWRICMTFIARLIHILSGGDGCRLSDKNAIMEKLVQYGLVSACQRENLLPRLTDWNLAGKKYNLLAEALGGSGAVIYLPELTSLTWEKHLPATKDGCTLIISLLDDVRTKANEKWHVPRTDKTATAHDVVDAIFTHALEKANGPDFLAINFHIPRESPRPQRPQKRKDTDSRPNSSSASKSPHRQTRNAKQTRHDAASSTPYFEVDDYQSEEGSASATVPPLGSTLNSSDIPQPPLYMAQTPSTALREKSPPRTRNTNIVSHESDGIPSQSQETRLCVLANVSGNITYSEGHQVNLDPDSIGGFMANSTSSAPNMQLSNPQPAYADQAVFPQPLPDNSSFASGMNSFNPADQPDPHNYAQHHQTMYTSSWSNENIPDESQRSPATQRNLLNTINNTEAQINPVGVESPATPPISCFPNASPTTSTQVQASPYSHFDPSSYMQLGNQTMHNFDPSRFMRLGNVTNLQTQPDNQTMHFDPSSYMQLGNQTMHYFDPSHFMQLGNLLNPQTQGENQTMHFDPSRYMQPGNLSNPQTEEEDQTMHFNAPSRMQPGSML